MPSQKQWVDIVESDMNGKVPNTSSIIILWNFVKYANYNPYNLIKDYTNTQNNTNDTCYPSVNYTFALIGSLSFHYVSKTHLSGEVPPNNRSYYYISSFRPIIECE